MSYVITRRWPLEFDAKWLLHAGSAREAVFLLFCFYFGRPSGIAFDLAASCWFHADADVDSVVAR
jgi:hypothetical protein